MAEDIRRQLGPNGLSLHKPVVAGPGIGPGGIPISSGRSKQYGIAGGSPAARKRSNDGALEQSMVQRLQKLEALNQSLKSEIREKSEQVMLLKDQNKKL